MADRQGTDFPFLIIRSLDELPPGIGRQDLARFFHETMKPYEDTLEDVDRALGYALVPGEGQGGYLALAHDGPDIKGCVCMLNTGMGGYVPATILLFVSVDPSGRGLGLGRKLISFALDHCHGDVKLHVEYDNPAKRLYERMGFKSKYAEMRLQRDGS